MIKHPSRRKQLCRNPSDRVKNVTPRLDVSVSLINPPVTATFRTQFPDLAVAAPERMPVTLTLGDPPVIQVDMEGFFTEAVRFVTEHPVMCMAIAAGIVFVISACNQQDRPAYA